jgi:hypothetical protein
MAHRKSSLSARLTNTIALCLALVAGTSALSAQQFPQYNHVFLIIMENEDFSQISNIPYAPILNALANDYGLATNYTGVADPSEPNYVAMLGGDFFGISSDDPYFFPGQTVNADNLPSQLERAGKTWRGYFQSMPYPGYRGYCYPDKCNGIPDADTQYVAKHNGMVNFANLQTPDEFAKMMPLQQLWLDLANSTVPDFSYIVPNECNDMHGAPPWCVDSNNPGTVQQNWLIAQGDKMVGQIVNAITSSSTWQDGNNAIVVTYDEGDVPSSLVFTVVITNHGPRGLQDNTSYNHYSLLASLQQTFSLGCLLNSCTASPMANLFAITGSNDVPTLPPPYNFPTSQDKISPEGQGLAAQPVNLNGSGWQVAPSPNVGNMDNILAAVSAASQTDAWAVGTYYPVPPTAVATSPLATLAQHFDGTRWTVYPLPNVGVQENALLAVSMPMPGKAWAVGYYVDGHFRQKTLVQHFDGSTWSVIPSPSPGAEQNILYGVAALSDGDAWAVGAEQDVTGLWHTLTEHWDGSQWSVVPAVDPGVRGNQFYAVRAKSAHDIYAVGQQAGTGFPNQALIEHWDGSVVPAPPDPNATALLLGVEVTPSALTVVGQQETDTAPYTTYVAAGPANGLTIQNTPNQGAGENDLFGVATGADGSTWAVGWDINTDTGNHDPLILRGQNGTWSLVSSPTLPGSDNGFAAITAIPGGGLWAVGVQGNASGSYATLIEYHP